MRKNHLAILISLSVLFTLTCSCTKSGTSESPAVTSASIPTEATANIESSASAEEAISSEVVSKEINLPISEDTVTYTIWTGLSPDISGKLQSYDQLSVVAELEKRTNIHLDATLVSNTEETVQFGLIVAGGDYPDIICGAQDKYSTGADGLINDGVCINLADEIEKYCPNYYERLIADDATYKATMTDSGTVASFYALYTEPLYDSTKSANHWIRGDWLKEQGLQNPETYSELHDVLANFYTNYGAVMVFSSAANEYLPGYGVSDTFYLDGNGEVAYGGLTDAYREYLTMLNKWYSENLIYKDYYNYSTSSLKDTTIYVTDKSGVFEYTSNNLTTLFKSYEGNLDVVPMTEPTINEGDFVTVGFERALQNGAKWSISTACENLEPLLTYIDYMYTDECAELWAYGLENEAFTYDSNGEKQFTDLILNNPNGYSQLVSFYMYTMSGMSGFPGIFNYFVSSVGWTDVQWEAFDVWSSNYGDNVNQYPSAANLTSDESEEYGTLYNDIETYQESMIAKFIIGEANASDDAVWNEYVATLNDLGVPRCVEIKQASYERYLER